MKVKDFIYYIDNFVKVVILDNDYNYLFDNDVVFLHGELLNAEVVFIRPYENGFSIRVKM